MASLVYKKKKGREYAYWVRSARVNGKTRIVEQIYLGPKDRFLEELKPKFNSCGGLGARKPLWHNNRGAYEPQSVVPISTFRDVDTNG